MLGYPGVQSLDVVGPFEVFASASLLLAAAGRDDGYDVALVSADGRPVLAATGLALVTAPLPDPARGSTPSCCRAASPTRWPSTRVSWTGSARSRPMPGGW